MPRVIGVDIPNNKRLEYLADLPLRGRAHAIAPDLQCTSNLDRWHEGQPT